MLIIYDKDTADVVIFCAVLVQVDAVLTMLSSLIQDQSDQPSAEEDPEDFAEEQGLLGRSVNSAAGIYVGHLESKERLRIQPAQLFNFS